MPLASCKSWALWNKVYYFIKSKSRFSVTFDFELYSNWQFKFTFSEEECHNNYYWNSMGFGKEQYLSAMVGMR